MQATEKRPVAEQRRRDRQRDQFLAMLAHELRNPLAAITSASGLLQNPAADPASQAEARQVLDRQCRQMARLLDDLLDVSRVSQGTIALVRQPVDLLRAVDEALCVARKWIDDRSQQLHVELPEGALWVEGDLDRLHQVIINLLSNASKYTPAGGQVQLSVGREAEQIVLRVGDSGLGIPPEIVGLLFEPFVQGEMPLDRAEAGLGIGLCLVRKIVHLHEGSVEASSPGANRGSQFTVRLPALDEAPLPPLPAAADPTLPLQVLVVEDNADVRETLVALLELDGHGVHSAADGRQGVALIEQTQPQVALVDIGLPELDGYQLAQCVRRGQASDHVFLIALTGYAQPEDRRRALASGFDEHLAKPVDVRKLSRLLARVRERTTAVNGGH